MNSKDKMLLENLVTKYGSKNVLNKINEGYNSVFSYGVAFSDFCDEEGLPITIKCEIPGEYRREFEIFLQENQDNFVYKACGYNNNFELD